MDYLKGSFDLEDCKEADGLGTFSGYASTFGNVDRGFDVVEKGAFKGARAENTVMLWNHNRDEIIGGWKNIEEDEKGLKVEGELNLEVRRGQEAYALLKRGHLKSMSIGYRPKPGGVKYDEKGIRRLLKLELPEISLVAIPMNEKAKVTRAKGIPDIRELEHFLRHDLGLSRAEAKALLAKGHASLASAAECEAGAGADETGREAGSMAHQIAGLRESLAILKT